MASTSNMQFAHIGVQVWLQAIVSIQDHATGHVASPASLVRRYDAEVELQRIRKGCNSFGASSIFRHAHRSVPVGYIMSDPSRNQRLRMEIVDWASEEALHLRGMQVNRNDMFNSGNVEKVRKHTCSDRTTM